MMKEILIRLKLKQHFTSELSDKNIILSDFRKPNYYYETSDAIFKDSNILVTREQDENGRSSHYIRYPFKEMTLSDVDQVEKDHEQALKTSQKRGAAAVAGTVAAFAVAAGASLLGIKYNPRSVGHGVQNMHDKIAGPQVGIFDREAYMKKITYLYHGKKVLYDDNYRFEIKGVPIRGVSQHCSAPVDEQCCVSIKTQGFYSTATGYDTYSYDSYEFYTMNDADQFLSVLKSILL